MKDIKKQLDRRARRAKRVRIRISGTVKHPRLHVFRSNKYIYAQFIDDASGATLISGSTRADGAGKKTKLERATLLGVKLAEKAKEKGITKAVLDRGAYKFHGRVQAMTEALRKEGIQI